MSIEILREAVVGNDKEVLPHSWDAIRVSHRSDAFSDLWPRSDSSAARSCYVFQCRDLLDVWQQTIGAARGTTPYFVVIADQRGEPWLALPLGIERRQGVRVLTFLDGGVSDYNAPVMLSRPHGARRLSLQKLIQRLRPVLPAFDIAIFEKMPADLIDGPNPLVGPSLALHAPFGHVSALGGSWQEFAKTRLPRRNDSRRKRRKLESLGRLEFVVADNDSARWRLLHAMIEQKTRRYIETRGFDGFDRPGYRNYFREMTSRCAHMVHLSALQLDRHVLATHWGLVAGSRFYFLMPGYDHEWSRFSPGRLLIEHLVEWSHEHGLTCFDFGVGDESYKLEFCNKTLPLYRATLPVTLRGSAYLAALQGKSRLGELRCRVRNFRLFSAKSASAEP